MGKRRGNTEGTIEERDGSWRTRVQVAGRRHSITGKTKAEVRKKLRELLSSVDKGVLPPSERLTVAQQSERWLQDVVKHSVRPRTHESYEELMRLYILPTLGHIKLTALQPGDLQKWHGHLLVDRELSTKTVRTAHTCLHTCLAQAVRANLCARNVAALVDPPRLKRKEIEYLTAEQARALVAAAKGGAVGGAGRGRPLFRDAPGGVAGTQMGGRGPRHRSAQRPASAPA